MLWLRASREEPRTATIRFRDGREICLRSVKLVDKTKEGVTVHISRSMRLIYPRGIVSRVISR